MAASTGVGDIRVSQVAEVRSRCHDINQKAADLRSPPHTCRCLGCPLVIPGPKIDYLQYPPKADTLFERPRRLLS